MRLILFTLLVGLVLAAAPVRAQPARFSPGENYNVDLFTGPVLGAGRIVGMSGAHVAIASGIDGAPYNPAGYAERYEKEIEWFAWDVTGALNLSAVFRRNDFDNNGQVTKGSSGSTVQITFGGRLQFSYFGSGATWQARRYDLRDDMGNKFQVTLQTVRAGAGYSFLNGGLVAGVTISTYLLDISDPDGDRAATFRGYGGEFGVLIRPARARYRVGFVARTPVSVSPREDTLFRGGAGGGEIPLVLPTKVNVPWELGWGVAYQFGERRSNTPWRNTRRLHRDLTEQIASGTYQTPDTWGERPYQPLPSDPNKAVDVAMATYRESERRFRRHQPRRYVLLAADLLVSGKTSRGHGLDAFLYQTPERSGEKVVYSARLGVESELWPDRMKVRAGSYVEPTRFRGSSYRPHGTLGFDVRLFDIWRWSVRGTGTIDYAPRYFNWGVAFGLWW